MFCLLALFGLMLKEMMSDDDVLPESLLLSVYLNLKVYLDEVGH